MTEIRRNLDVDELVRLDTAHHLHPFTDHKSLAAEGGSRIISRAEGVYLYDSSNNKILDGMAGLWCVNVGYGRDELADVAYRQMKELPFYNTFFKTAHAPSIELATKVASILPEGFNHVTFANSGSEANDTQLRMVHHYWQCAGRPDKRFVIARDNAYHGSTVAGAGLGGMGPMHKQGGKLIPTIHHVMQPYWYKLGGEMSREEFGLAAAKSLEDKILELGPDNVAAFIGEPIQGAGGVIIPPSTYWPEINRICKQYDILLIADEVICGFGRTGEWFGTNTFGIEPDLITMAKGLSSGYLPIAATGVSDRVANMIIDNGGEFYHGYTYSGHPVAAAVALRNIEIIERENLVQKTKMETGPYLAKKLEEIKDHPLVGEVRCIGLIGGIELTKNKQTREGFAPAGRVGTMCRDHFFKRNAIMRACGDTMVLSPPLIIKPAEIDELIGILRECLDATAKDLGIM
ncbi:MAG TPA: aspartate aminotransferase family protein [Rhodospirillaceae bacterium]|nr:aspartate aminotransferase family protein [Rhodospirillaceae bacterium]MBB58177.1 aspartate aminotransferase family protein [Rhodospirillaceae bacterium]HBM14550.1 aspartate aminotransferase family protein [Rhodospirillaceae bacterium]|tara:strand:+ start:38454 stop:39836 length:1383 start_codon:yes stop_codon:yes gene_type:complete